METLFAEKLVQFSHVPLSILSVLTAFEWPKQAIFENGASYDYIVIGSGAGSVVANRLSENQNLSVLLVEAGGIPSVASTLASQFASLQNSNEDWQYKSEKEMASQSQSGDVFKMASGKVLGGSSAINHFIYLRGSPIDYDNWAATVGDDKWSYKEILPYFLKSERIQDEEIMNSIYSKFHFDDGPMALTREIYEEAVDYLRAFEEVGRKTVLDLNGNITTGYTVPLLINGKRKSVGVINIRHSLSQSYISPIRDRENLHVSYRTLATKINFDKNKNAVSVDLINDYTKMTIKARREIILCAGVFNSPKLLMLSGIGPREHLESLNIPVIEDLPVGENMQDHVAVQFVHKMQASVELPKIPSLTKIPFQVIIGADNRDKSKTYPESQVTNLLFFHDAPFIPLTCGQIFGFKEEICDEIKHKSTLRNTMYSLVAHLQPKSRGVVKLRSNDPIDSPIILENFYSDESDLDDMVDFIADFITIRNSTYFKEANSELINLNLENCNGDFNDREYIRCFVKHMSTSLYHYTSTCPMGTVLDSNLNVKGVQKIKVIDASAFPKIPRANPFASVVMLAEKGADIIKNSQ